MLGIHKPYLYVGGPLTSFGLHIEDGDLGSISYNHGGHAKIWYPIPGTQSEKLEGLVRKYTPKYCDFYIRHKSTMVPPSVLQAHGIKFARVRQFMDN